MNRYLKKVVIMSVAVALSTTAILCCCFTAQPQAEHPQVAAMPCHETHETADAGQTTPECDCPKLATVLAFSVEDNFTTYVREAFDSIETFASSMTSWSLDLTHQALVLDIRSGPHLQTDRLYIINRVLRL